MRVKSITSKLIWVLLVLGAIISIGAYARSHWTWFAVLCGFTQSGCSHADLYELLGLPIALWGFGFYLFAALLYGRLPSWLPLWLTIGVGVELALIYEMLTQGFVCQICLANALIICIILIINIKRFLSWRSVAICLIAFWAMNVALKIENRDLNAGCDPITGKEVVAKINGRIITLTDLESEIATPLNDMRQEIYFLKRNHLEALVERILTEQPGNSHVAQGGDQTVPAKGSTEDTAQMAQRMVVDLQRSQPDIDRYLERPTSPFTQIRIGDSPRTGRDDAKVTVIVFSDYRCPKCQMAHPIIKDLQNAYKERVRWVFKDFPSRYHAGAVELAEAAQCAHDQGGYWQFQDALFTSDFKINLADLPQLAQRLGLEVGEFTQCYESKKYSQVIQHNIADAGRAGVSVTPSFIINGRLFVGVLSSENLKKHIDDALHR